MDNWIYMKSTSELVIPESTRDVLAMASS